jgi:protein subunit release factor B
VIHHPSGARGESREERSQLQNRKAAWRRMVADPKFKIWINTQLYGLELAESKVARDMAEKNIRVEVKKDGKWICQ